MTVVSPHFAQLDMGQPLEADTARLQHHFSQPVQVLQAVDAQTLKTVLQQVEQAAQRGYWCVGGLRYEAASALHPQL
ncbi:MAG: bifunctional aminodeoxychorismate synthase component I/aminotransferase, partial [Brachymonas sp.]|nr:bifunctional aminodeoxychorismate synthase component I/aminotransferase [Brachymonas sp.]